MTRFLLAGMITAVRVGCWVILGIPVLPTVSLAQGFHRSRVGDFEIIALQDGVISYPTAQVLPGATPEQIRTRLAAVDDSDTASHSMLVDQRVESRIVALANHYHCRASELGHRGCNRFERTEVGAHEDRTAPGREGRVDAREGLVFYA